MLARKLCSSCISTAAPYQSSSIKRLAQWCERHQRLGYWLWVCKCVFFKIKCWFLFLGILKLQLLCSVVPVFFVCLFFWSSTYSLCQFPSKSQFSFYMDSDALCKLTGVVYKCIFFFCNPQDRVLATEFKKRSFGINFCVHPAKHSITTRVRLSMMRTYAMCLLSRH